MEDKDKDIASEMSDLDDTDHGLMGISPSRELTVMVLSSPSNLDGLMHSLDVFSQSKALVTPEVLTVTLKVGCSIEKGLSDLRMVYEEVGRRVTAVFIPGDPRGAWKDDSVQTISDGHKWTMLDDYLKYYNFVSDDYV